MDQVVLLLHLPLDHLSSYLAVARLTATTENFCAATLKCIVVDDIANFEDIDLSGVHELVEGGTVHLELAETFKLLLEFFLSFQNAFVYLIEFIDDGPQALDLFVFKKLIVFLIEQHEQIKCFSSVN